MPLCNHLQSVLNERAKPAICLWQMLPGANISRALARIPGVDCVLIDCEHGNIDDRAMNDSVPACAAAGISPIVRIPDMQSWMIKRALDAGAHGILVPLIRNAREAKGIVQAAKFPPLGKRGLGSPVAMERFNPIPTITEYLQEANGSLLTMVQIETQEALGEVEDIAAVDGIDVLFIGPFDLGNSIGQPILDGEITPGLRAAISRILGATHTAGKQCGIFCTSGQQAKEFADAGFDFISVATDYAALQSSAASAVSVARSNGKLSSSGSY